MGAREAKGGNPSGEHQVETPKETASRNDCLTLDPIALRDSHAVVNRHIAVDFASSGSSSSFEEWKLSMTGPARWDRNNRSGLRLIGR